MMTSMQRRSVKRRSVGRMENGLPAFLVRPGDTEEMAQAILDQYDDGFVLAGKQVVEWCCHSLLYAYRHGCADWCDNPSSRIVWTSIRSAWVPAS